MNAYPVCPESERRLLATLQPPSDQPGKASALRAAALALQVFAQTLENPRLNLHEIVADYACYAGPLEPRLDCLHRRKARYPVWNVLLSLRPDAPQFVLEALGAAIAGALVEARALPVGLMRSIERAGGMRGSYRDEQRLRGVVVAARTRFSLEWGPAEAPSLRARLQRFFRALDEHAGEHLHQCRQDRRTLSAERYRLAARELRLRVERGDDAALWMGVCAVSGLGAELAGEIPLCDDGRAPDIAIDIQAGTFTLNLDLVAPGARSTPDEAVDTIGAVRSVVRPLPAFLSEALSARRRDRPHARCISELLGCAVPNERDQLTISDHAGGFTPSLARFLKTTEQLAVTCGVHRIHAMHLGGRYQCATRSKLYYSVLQREALWASAEQLFTEIGWGPAMPLQPGPAFGAQAVATDVSIARWFDWMRESVQVVAPGRRYTFSSLLRHHNEYARLVASVCAFCLALRRAHPLPILADIDYDGGWIALSDKRTPSVWNPSADTALLPVVPACRLVREQLACWRRHCAALARRLEHLSSPDTLYLQAHLCAIADGDPIPALIEADQQARPSVLGSQDLERWWPDWFKRSGNWGRSFWQTRLTQEGVPGRQIDLLLRHTQSGMRPLTNVDSAPITAEVAAVCRAQEALLRQLGLDVTTGLVK